MKTETSTQRICDCGYMFGAVPICTKCGRSHPVWGKPLLVRNFMGGDFVPNAAAIQLALIGLPQRQTVRDLVSAGF